MTIVTLDRFCYTDLGTLGRLSFQGLRWYTIELPWKDNQSAISCIPLGDYPLRLDWHHPGQPDSYQVYEVDDVPSRSQIQFHVFNRPSESRGCIGPGMAVTVMGGELAVTQSRVAFDQFMAAMDYRPAAQLLVRES